jgi:hypothetical protein
VLLSVETSNPSGAIIFTAPVTPAPFTVKLFAADGVPVAVVKFPIVDTEIQIRGGVLICNWKA